MNLRITVTIGNRTITKEHRKDDAVFARRHFLLAALEEIHEQMWNDMAPDIDEALEALKESEGIS